MPAGPPPGAAPGLVTVRLLGSFEVRGDSSGAVLGARDLGGGKPRQIFAILALHAGSVVSKEHLVELLWDGRPPSEAAATLESYVSVLRNHLRPVCSDRSRLVRTAVAGYTVAREHVRLDVEHFRTLLHQAETAEPPRAHGLLQQALLLGEAPLLVEERASSWADDLRRTHARLVHGALVSAAEAAAALGLTDVALATSERALAADPHSEAAWAARLTALERAGRHAEALRAFGECRRRFARELGCAPGPVLQDVQRRLLDGAAEVDAELGDLIVALLRLRDHVDGGADLRTARDLAEACAALEDLVARARSASRANG
jgi:DNA-binding SARP family transcriptional activator